MGEIPNCPLCGKTLTRDGIWVGSLDAGRLIATGALVCRVAPCALVGLQMSEGQVRALRAATSGTGRAEKAEARVRDLEARVRELESTVAADLVCSTCGSSPDGEVCAGCFDGVYRAEDEEADG